MRKFYGITLTELLISITFLSLVVLSAVAIDTAANRFLTNENAQTRVALEASVTLEHIAKNIQLSFGNPVNSAFNIIDPGPNAGNRLKIRRVDIAPDGPDANDKWVAYRYDAINHLIEFNDDLFGAGVYITIARNVIAINPIFQVVDADGDGNAFNDNVIRIEVTCRQNPSQPASTVNSEVTLTTTIRIPSLSSS